MADFTLPRITEKRYYKITPQAFTANGTTDGTVTIASTYGFKVGQLVVLQSNILSQRQVKVKRVISSTQLVVISTSDPVTTSNKLDISSFLVADSSTISLQEDKRPTIDLLEIQRQVYEEEPTVALRSHLVDWLGRSYDNANPIPTLDSASSTVLGDIFDTLEDGVLSVGTDDGTPSGTPYVFVNNEFSQILAAADRVDQFIYADAGTKNERIIEINTTGNTVHVSKTARKQISYTLVGNSYVLTSIIKSVI